MHVAESTFFAYLARARLVKATEVSPALLDLFSGGPGHPDLIRKLLCISQLHESSQEAPWLACNNTGKEDIGGKCVGRSVADSMIDTPYYSSHHYDISCCLLIARRLSLYP